MSEQHEFDTSSSPTSTRPASGLGTMRWYSLEPLRKQGAAALACSDIDGVERVTLREVRFLWGGADHEVEIRRADDVFRSIGRRNWSFPTKASLVAASFLVKIAAVRTPREFSIHAGEPIEPEGNPEWSSFARWLEAHGFVVEEGGHDAAAVSSLVGR